jgi:hypothetical protein
VKARVLNEESRKITDKDGSFFTLRSVGDSVIGEKQE